MKNTIILLLCILAALSLSAQQTESIAVKTGREHKGFFLSMSLGPNFPSITDEVVNSYNYKFTGTGLLFDFKIGGAVKEDFILHATITSASMPGPRITSEGSSLHLSNNLSLGEAMIGGGFTYYMMPQNIFFSASVGMGNFTLIDNDNETSISTDRGISLQLKAGKEWWVSKRWGLGIALVYGKTSLTNSPTNGLDELMNSNNIAVVFNATLN